jgi:hypothetical protein
MAVTNTGLWHWAFPIRLATLRSTGSGNIVAMGRSLWLRESCWLACQLKARVVAAGWPGHWPGSRSSLRCWGSCCLILGGRLCCQRIRHTLPNLVAIDFYKRGDVLGVVRALNGLPR